jgi:hypothetical protein
MSYQFANRKVYSFDVYPSPVFGTGFKNVTVQAVLDYDAATNFADIEALHVNVYSYLPPGTPNRPQDFDYLLLKTEGGDTTVIGIPWIIEETIEVVQSLKAQVIIDGLASSGDLERIRACLSQNGFDKLTISLIGK